jgi:rod shape-determining protein MreC
VVRQAVAVVLYPLQRIAAAPVSLARRIGGYFDSQAILRDENVRLSRENFANAALIQKMRALEAENANLRNLLDAKEKRPEQLTLAEVLYRERDPFSQRVVIDKGTQHGLQNGQPVIDAFGVVGQVTRVYPMQAEVTLISDKGHLVPVINTRSGMRSVLVGTGAHGPLELQFVPMNADVRKGDQLITSGIDGVYSPGLPVAEVVSIDPNLTTTLSRVVCRPLGGVTSHRWLFVVHGSEPMPPRPSDDGGKGQRVRRGRRGG